MTHNFNSLVKFGLGLFMAGSASHGQYLKMKKMHISCGFIKRM